MAGDPWGACEELWSQTALRLSKQGLSVGASVQGWPRLNSRVLNLTQSGIIVRPRPLKPSIVGRVRRHVSRRPQIAVDLEMTFGRSSPRLVVVSDGWAFPQIELLEMFVAKGWPFATLLHANWDAWWLSDDMCTRYRATLPLAKQCFFVSEANRILEEMQLGYSFNNAEIVQNPINIDVKAPLPWPAISIDQELRMACVGRLYPAQKGQDILLQILAKPRWLERSWRLNLYGEGPNRDILERLIRRLNLSNRVSFAGYVAVEKIWRENHVLVMPSRYEGVPLTTVEAMFCGRPVVATNVGGNPAVIEDGVTGFLAAPVLECFEEALERMWEDRDDLQDIGKAGEMSVRKFLLKDPVGVFTAKIRSLACLPKEA